MTTYIFQSKTYLDIPIKWFWGCIWPCNVFYSSSTLKQVDPSIAWSLKIFLHLKWTSDQEGCVAKFEKNCQEIFISSEHLIFWPGWLACLDILSPAPNIHPSRLILLLTRAFRALWPSELGIIYIYTWIDFLWMTSINSKIEITVFVNEEGSEMHLVTICHQIRW